ncbi:hypothetical protein J7337_009390 [Fusarium musae]|uniref:Uncharacterized protein n=1 Tax=Fusarium musae TaxID=1042133 RepID=A0A9P8DB77_9HYPO|nr:hypothetical protein J7337_009390 [Fusarium musae]KAG9498582.1 hypothetical protein J7337_009390 [Fusarium musae]
MSRNPQGMQSITDAIEQDFAYGRRPWSSTCPVPMPHEPVYKFSESALPVGHFKDDIPSDGSPSANRKKDAKAYLMVKRDGDKTGFLWCDADGEAVEKDCIEMAEGLVVKKLKKDLVEMYNAQEERLVKDYNCAILVMVARRMLVKFAERGTAEPPVIDDEDRIERFIPYIKKDVLCSETDPELN